MIKHGAALLALSFFVTACCATGSPPRQCPFGTMKEIHVSGDYPQRMALQQAAQSTLDEGYEKFTVVRGEEQGNSYHILIKMSHSADQTDIFHDTWMAKDVLASIDSGISPL